MYFILIEDMNRTLSRRQILTISYVVFPKYIGTRLYLYTRIGEYCVRNGSATY